MREKKRFGHWWLPPFSFECLERGSVMSWYCLWWKIEGEMAESALARTYQPEPVPPANCGAWVSEEKTRDEINMLTAYRPHLGLIARSARQAGFRTPFTTTNTAIATRHPTAAALHPCLPSDGWEGVWWWWCGGDDNASVVEPPAWCHHTPDKRVRWEGRVSHHPTPPVSAALRRVSQ